MRGWLCGSVGLVRKLGGRVGFMDNWSCESRGYVYIFIFVFYFVVGNFEFVVFCIVWLCFRFVCMRCYVKFCVDFWGYCFSNVIIGVMCVFCCFFWLFVCLFIYLSYIYVIEYKLWFYVNVVVVMWFINDGFFIVRMVVLGWDWV